MLRTLWFRISSALRGTSRAEEWRERGVTGLRQRRVGRAAGRLRAVEDEQSRPFCIQAVLVTKRNLYESLALLFLIRWKLHPGYLAAISVGPRPA